jgi:hypothetical protein
MWPAPTTLPLSPAGEVFPALHQDAVDVYYQVRHGWTHDEAASALIKAYFRTYVDLSVVPFLWTDLFPCEYYEVCEEFAETP